MTSEVSNGQHIKNFVLDKNSHAKSPYSEWMQNQSGNHYLAIYGKKGVKNKQLTKFFLVS